MSRFICLAFFIACSSATFSQKEYFVYFQSEAEQPFFIKIGEKTYSSTQAGYLILSQLKDSSYSVKVGFPQNKWPDQQFSIAIKSKDRGYLLKHFGEKGWGLFDLQSMSIQMAAENNAKTVKRELKEVSAFTEILSRAANDPSLREAPVFAVAKVDQKQENISPALVKQETHAVKTSTVEPKSTVSTQEKKDTVRSLATTPKSDMGTERPDSSIKLSTATTNPPVAKTEPVKEETLPAAKDSQVLIVKEEPKTAPADYYKKTIVTKKSESSTSGGFGVTFIDHHANGQKDTIQIFIPDTKMPYVNEKGQQVDSREFLDFTGEENKAIVSKAAAKNNCSSVGSQNDFLKLRKKMAGQKTEDAMIEEAKKGFKLKCYTTEHIKNLGNLFLNEAGKFQFYEAVYPYSSDRDNFAVLQTELKDNYFIYRFKNLVKPGGL